MMLVEVKTVSTKSVLLSKELRRKLEVAQKEKDGIQLTVEKLKNASKSLNKIINCQIVDNCKKGLGYKSYNAVLPSYTGNFMPPKHDLSYTGLDEVTDKPIAENTKSSEEETKAVRKNSDAPINEDWCQMMRMRMVNTVRRKNINTARPKAIVNAVKRNHGKPQMDLQDKGVIDSGCSRHTTRNMSYLIDYEEINGGYVAFGGNPKRGKIIGKEAVNTACYVQNRVLVVKPHNKTSYELFHGRTPTLSFMLPFGCPVTILNTKDHLGKFDCKVDEGFFIEYSLNSKAIRVFNSRTKIVEENLHIRFSENTPNVIGSGPDWLFVIDALTRTINYEPIVAGTQSNNFADLKSSQDDGFKPLSDDGNKFDEDPTKEIECNDQEKEMNVNNTNNVNTVSLTVNAAGTNEDNELLFDPNMPALEDEELLQFKLQDVWTLVDLPNRKKAIGTKRVFRNKKDERGIVIRNKARLVAQGHIQEEGIDYDKAFAAIARIKAIRLFLAYASYEFYGRTCIFLGLQVKQKNDGIFISQDKYVAEILKKFGFTKVKNASTPMKAQKPLLKDEYGEEVDVHVYRYKVNPKVLHLHIVKRIFRYLKGHPKLGLWYPKDSPFDLVAYTYSDYAGASLDRKSKTRDDKEIIITESSIRRDLQLADEEGVDCFPNSTIFKNLELIEHVANEAVYKELDERLARVITTASSLEAEQDSDNIDKTQSEATPNEASSPGTSSGDGPRCQEAMGDTIAQTRVLDLEKTKTTQVLEIDSLKRRVKKLKKKQRSRTHKLKKLYKVGLTARVDSSKDEQNLGEDASKQGRIEAIDANEDITLVNDQDDAEMFDVNDLQGEEVFVDKEVADKEVNDEENNEVQEVVKDINIAKLIVDAAHVNADGEVNVLTDEEKATLFMQLLEKRIKFFATKRAKEKRNKPPTQAQQRKIMCTYLKNIEGKKLKDLKNKFFDSIQKMFDRAFRRVNTFVDHKIELVEGSSKRAGKELTQESAKNQKMEDDKEIAELKQLIEIIRDEEKVAIDAIPLAVIQMLKSFDREDLEDLYKLVKAKFGSTTPVEDLDLLLWGDLKTMFEPHVEDVVWRKQQGYKGRIVGIKSHLNAVGVNTTQLELLLLEEFVNVAA
uniref:Retrovirus-related Pol polyprotein from transposon TNT 1-94 n=1 Tax=Tanacetum cinerariifolium TaxID=118510 RepID=A0A6L2M5I2_TANCI|nr:retrovirus-related Pol polyprotein from transposon TNT 1-94 [Tanacetum cinerariifolium]